MSKKPWYRSRVLWFNAVVTALAVAEAQFGVLQPYLPGNVYAWLSFVLPVGNAVLRFMTNSGIGKAGPHV